MGVFFGGILSLLVGATKLLSGTSGRVLYNNSGTLGEMTTSGSGTQLALTNSPALVTPNLGTPSAVTLTNGTGLPVSTGITGLGTNVATFLATPSSANFAAAITDEVGTGSVLLGSGTTAWTPTILFGGGSTGVTYSNQTGTYQRVGNLIVALFYLALSAKGSSTGSVQIGGLPTASSASAANYGAMGNVLLAANGSAVPSAGLVLQLGPSSTAAYITYQGATGQTFLTNAAFTDTTVITGSLIYGI